MIGLSIFGLLLIVLFVVIEQIVSFIFLPLLQLFLKIRKSKGTVSYKFHLNNIGSSFVVKAVFLFITAIAIDIIDQIMYVEDQGFQDKFSYKFLSDHVSEILPFLIPSLLISWILYLVSILRNNTYRKKYSRLQLSLLITNSIFLSMVVLRGIHNISWSV